ncbi:MAG: T9SS type A sorting domain-containing protein [Calditrichia bacterium]
MKIINIYAKLLLIFVLMTLFTTTHLNAYGFASHMAHKDEILAIYPPGTPIGDLITTHEAYFLYGSIFPDAQFANRLKSSLTDIYDEVEGTFGVKRVTYKILVDNVPDGDFPFGFDTHHPLYGLDFAEFMLQQANLPNPPGPNPPEGSNWITNPARGEKLAFALGYYAHLSEDIVAHEFFVPEILAGSNIGALSILKVEENDPNNLIEIPGESETAIEINTDYRLGSTASDLVEDVVFNDFWVKVGQLEPPVPLIIYINGIAIEFYKGGTNPTLKFFQECVQQWNTMHPEYFENPPINLLGLVQMCHMFRFQNRFYGEAVGHGSLPDELTDWIVNHIDWETWVDLTPAFLAATIGVIKAIVLKEFFDDFVEGTVLGQSKEKALEASKTFFGIMNNDVGETNAYTSSKPDLFNLDEYNIFKQSPVYSSSSFLLDPFNSRYKALGAKVFEDVGPGSNWNTSWSPRNVNSLRGAVQTSLNNQLTQDYEARNDLAVYDCYFTVNGIRVAEQSIDYSELGINNVQAVAELYNLVDTSPINVTLKVRALNNSPPNNIISQSSVTINHDPLTYTSTNRTEIFTTFGLTELAKHLSVQDGFVIELFANGNTKPFFTTLWDIYSTVPQVDPLPKAIYREFNTYQYWPHSLLIESSTPVNLTLSNLVINYSTDYTAINSITAGPNFTITNTGDVSLNSGSQIRLVNGFTAVAGSGFSAKIDQNISSPILANVDNQLRSKGSIHSGQTERRQKPGFDKAKIRYSPQEVYAKGTINKQSETKLPERFELEANYPNPFNPSTTISYAIKYETPVILTIYDVLGKEVATLVDKPQAAGYYSVTWDGINQHGALVGSGVYVYRINAGDFTKSHRMVFMK